MGTTAKVKIHLPEATLKIAEGTSQQTLQLSVFIFCGKKRNRIKALIWEGDGLTLLYKRLAEGKFQWPRNEEELRPITWQQFRWLMEGLQIEQKKVIKPVDPGEIY